MAIVKFNNRKNSVNSNKRNRLKRAIDYITDPKKTSKDLIGGSNVRVNNALLEMQTVKKLYGKQGGREYVHFCISFKGKLNADTIFFISEEVSKIFEGFQVLFAVHTNTDNYHCHFIINAVNFETGKKFSQSRGDLRNLKLIIEDIIRRYAFEEVEDDYYLPEDDIVEEYEFDENGLRIAMDFYDEEECEENYEIFDYDIPT